MYICIKSIETTEKCDFPSNSIFALISTFDTNFRQSSTYE